VKKLLTHSLTELQFSVASQSSSSGAAGPEIHLQSSATVSVSAEIQTQSTAADNLPSSGTLETGAQSSLKDKDQWMTGTANVEPQSSTTHQSNSGTVSAAIPTQLTAADNASSSEPFETKLQPSGPAAEPALQPQSSTSYLSITGTDQDQGLVSCGKFTCSCSGSIMMTLFPHVTSEPDCRDLEWVCLTMCDICKSIFF